jgi:glycosyltransferase involved in cell wall biosynthesis
MKLLFLFSTPTLTGQAAQPFALACEMHRRGHTVVIAKDTKRKGDFEGFIESAGIPWLQWLTLCTKSGPHESMMDVARLKKAFKSLGPDVVISAYSHDHVLASLARGASASPPIIRFFNSTPRSDVFTARVMKGSAAIVFFVKSYMDEFKKACPPAAGRAVLMPGPVDLSSFGPGEGGRYFRRAFGLHQNHIVVGMVARFQEGRAQDTVIRAFAEAEKKHHRLRLMLVGFGETKHRMEDLAASMGLGDRVVFTGFRTADLPDAYRAMDVFVQMEEGHDTSCRAVVEAMATEVPVIVVRKGAMAELIRDGVEGLFVEGKGDAGPLAAAIDRLASDQELRKRMGAAAREEAVRTHALPKAVDRFQELLESVIKAG